MDVLAFGEYNPAFYSIEQQEAVAGEWRARDLRASSVVTCAQGNISSPDPQEAEFAMEQMKRAVCLAKRLGGQQLLVGKGCGNIDFHLSRREAFQNSMAFLKRLSKWCLNQNAIVTLELEPEALHVCNGIAAYIRKAIELGIDRTAESLGDVAVAAIEAGEPGEYIADSDIRVLRSVGNVLLRVPELRTPYETASV